MSEGECTYQILRRKKNPSKMTQTEKKKFKNSGDL